MRVAFLLYFAAIALRALTVRCLALPLKTSAKLLLTRVGFTMRSVAVGVSMWSLRRRNTETSLPPGKAKLPVFGDTFDLMNPRAMGDYQLDAGRRWGPIWKTSLFFKPAVCITGAHHLHDAFCEESRHSTEPFFPPHHRKLLGPDSILVHADDSNKNLLSILQQALNPVAVTAYKDSMDHAVCDFLRHLIQKQEMVGNRPLIMAQELRRFFVVVTLRILLGQKTLQAAAGIINDFIEDIQLWSRGLLAAPLLWLPWSTAARAMRARRRIKSTLSRIIKEGRRDIAQRITACSEGGTEWEPETLMERFITARSSKNSKCQGLSDAEIIDNVLSILFAGSTTTADTLASAFLILMEDEELKNQLAASMEVENPHCDVVEDFLEEVVRAQPPTSFTMRVVTDESGFRFGNYIVPRGWLLVYGYSSIFAGAPVSNLDVYRDTQLFPLPSCSAKQTQMLSQVAVNRGPRVCPGKRIAMMEAKSLLHAMLVKYRIDMQPAGDQDVQMQYSRGRFPVDGLRVRLQ